MSTEPRLNEPSGDQRRADQREKRRVTAVSIVAALVLTGLKLIAGLATGSLGLLSEAAHSGLDAVASLFTFASVRLADQPADPDHPYGHGRFENLSAVLQGLLLLATATFIAVEAVRRILTPSTEVDPSFWAFGVMGFSIVVDVWRSRLLLAAARKFHSKALEADALNFRADLLSSSVVIVGLALTAVASRFQSLSWLLDADAVAALAVALLIATMSVRLAVQSLNVMLDRAPVALQERLTEAVRNVPGVDESGPVRLRESGNKLFADVTVSTSRALSLTAAHGVSEHIERAIKQVEPRVETLVHVEPGVSEDEPASAALRAVALELGCDTHHEHVYQVGNHLEASLHLVVSPSVTLESAHRRAHELVAAARRDNPRLTRVETHLEVSEPELISQRDVSGEQPELVTRLRHTIETAGLDAEVNDLRLYHHEEAPNVWQVVVHCGFPRKLLMTEVHQRTEALELLVRQMPLAVERVLIHAEPRL